jgi:hypothetical protein
VSGATLLLSADVLAAGGFVTIGVVGQGKNFENGTTLTTNGTDYEVQFPLEPAGLKSLVGKEVQLSISVRDAAVYTVGFR